jgi:2-polyprenylphenol 6-hydroxylase
MRSEFDLVILGGGLVGLSLAAALRDSDLRLARVEPHALPALPPDDAWDSRCYAIGPGTAEFLAQAAAWQSLPDARVARIETMKVVGDDGKSCLTLSAYDAGLRELAFIVENGRLQHALARAAGDAARIFCPADWSTFDVGEEGVRLTLEDGTPITARLIVGADGADSRVRSRAGIGVTAHDYRQLGVVANFGCERPHRSTAFQWFRRDGVLALLPLPGCRVSMVWSVEASRARELLALAPSDLAATVAAASGHALGELASITPAAAFPLKLQRVASCVRPRLALIGDAAHTVHPLAGQGVNLGFRDARELARVLRARAPRQDCGEYPLLRRYERARREDVAALQWMTHGLQKLFGQDSVCLARARNFGLDVLDGQPWMKSLLIHRAVA